MTASARLRLVADAAGRARFVSSRLRGSAVLAVAVEDALDRVPAVRQVYAYPRTGSIVVWYDATRCRHDDLAAAIRRGLETDSAATPARPPRSTEARTADLVRMVVGGVALAGLGIRRYGLRRPPVLGSTGRMVATGVAVFTGGPFLRGALRSLTGGRGVGTDALVTAATVASLVLRENVVALTVLWLLNIGEYLQDLTLRRSRRALSELLVGAQARTWRRLADGTEVEVDIADVSIGDEIVVHEQVVLPVDGVVVAGDGIADQSAVTGEQLPVAVGVGKRMPAGSVLVQGRIVVRASAVGPDTAIGRIIARVEQARVDRAPIQTVGENFSRRFVPVSFALSALTLVVTRDVRRAMTMLLVACPCAVGLSTPTAISAAIGNGARRGVLIKGGAHLEAAGRVDAIVFDKTGTLTAGRPVVTNVVSFDEEWAPERVLAYAASSEIHSRHPLAQAVIRSTEERRIQIPPHEECEVLVGQGMRVHSDGRVILIGSGDLLRDQNVPISQVADGWVRRLRQVAETPLLLAVDNTLIGLVSLRDTVRGESRAVLDALRGDGITRVVLLTGDHPTTAAAVAAELGIDEFRAQVMPEDKQDIVRQLRAEGHTVAVVGDGINDAPALALADIGIAMGVAGADIAVETADVALADDDLRGLVDLRDLSRRGIAVIRQNYGMSIAVNMVGLLISAVGALSPVAAAVLHNAASVAVVGNSSRLIRYRIERPVLDHRRTGQVEESTAAGPSH
ncbi:heavy metal translocating P-type ATPase [Kutzneria sp. CA-103260]|uniref:heavy metal translocating P-type ATPase n=1 Tax=Kutzneria sp. CA-103260 TaxID=2802641 RepID=UPI001BA4F60D|nr:cation-translocating P-type ATPase [Kutzneria sp. CA-103260]QUQ64474.1 cadmium transporting P-type ATPase [Kutzneria sp. CA-103260]